VLEAVLEGELERGYSERIPNSSKVDDPDMPYTDLSGFFGRNHSYICMNPSHK
jgi:hypothetical protein